MYARILFCLLVVVAVLLEQCAWAEELILQYDMNTGQWETYYVLHPDDMESTNGPIYYDFQSGDWVTILRGSEEDGYIIPSGTDGETE